MKHHITLVGKEILPIYYAIKEYNSDCIHIIYTSETELIAYRISNIISLNIPCTLYKVLPYYVQDVVTICEKIHDKFKGDDFLYNLTGGTKPMAFGAHSVALRNNAEVIYTSQQNEIINLNTYLVNPMKCRLSNQEIIGLSGQKLNSYSELTFLDPLLTQCAIQIKNFIEIKSSYYREISRYVKNNFDSTSLNLPNTFNINNYIFFQKSETNGFKLETNEETLFESDHPQSTFLFFEGRWWETLVADAIFCWNKKREKNSEIWQNVIFNLIAEDPKIKNEVDILINLGTKMLFIECKSGKITQSDVYKITQVRDTYGGEMSKTVLVSYYPVTTDIAEKCQEAQINLFAPQFAYQRKKHLEKLDSYLNNIILNLNT